CADAADQRHHPPITEDNTARATDDSDKSPSTESTTDVSTEAVGQFNVTGRPQRNRKVARLYNMKKTTKYFADSLNAAHLFIPAKTRFSTAVMEQNHQSGPEDAQPPVP
ncbi:Uncharacterized protein APZ42_008396, partial [Daphnia magna]